MTASLRATGRIALVSALAAPGVADAHGFGRLYNLPVPFWLYAWAATAALLLSFLLVLYFVAKPAGVPVVRSRPLISALPTGVLCHLIGAAKLISVLLLVLCIATAWFGNRDPYRNFSMTFFWVVILLGLTYCTAGIGNLYAVLNPWRVVTGWIGRWWPAYRRGCVAYPPWLGYWPALLLFLGFIWLELFGRGVPGQLAWMLLGYTALNLVGVGVVGSRAWFRHCEWFAVYLRLFARMAPFAIRRTALCWRAPCSGLVETRPSQLSTVVFVMAMLSTTAFDGLRATQWWVRLFWSDPTGWAEAVMGGRPLLNIAVARQWYIAWETLCLLASPFLYFAAYMACIAVAKLATRSAYSLRQLALAFAYPLLPIALVYHMTHYATLLLTQGRKILSLASDPFGWGWNLFGTAMKWRAPILPDMSLVWHTQVGLILLGHVISVVVSHRVAVRLFGSRRDAAISQIALLILMVWLTIAGLWIIAQPLTVERMR